MRFARFKVKDQEAKWGIVEQDAIVEVEGDIFGRYGATKNIYSSDEVRLLAPVEPSKIIGLGSNFPKHAVEMGKTPATHPKIFLKPPSALTGQHSPIRLPEVEGAIEHEAELAVVIGRKAHKVSQSEALDYVLGYTCFNDVTARHYQRIDGLYARAKGFDTFAPCGPWIQMDAHWEDLRIECWVNGQRRQQGELKDALTTVPMAIEFISNIMTLYPGDLIAMGTPEGVGPLQTGDEVEVRIDAIGSLTNPVIDA